MGPCAMPILVAYSKRLYFTLSIQSRVFMPKHGVVGEPFRSSEWRYLVVREGGGRVGGGQCEHGNRRAP